jgi:pyridoxamine 5'-phosphate oxidase
VETPPVISTDMKPLNIAELRRSYTKSGLLEDMMPPEPVELIRLWIHQAIESEVLEPNAMTLSTVKQDGTPDSRMVLLKGIEGDSLSFYTNYRSEKAADLEVNPIASCCFWWPELERQLRLKGDVEKVSREESAEYFAIRPRDSQIGAWASDQSKSLNNREELIQKFREFEEKFHDAEVPLPDNWGGYLIRLNEVEFWQGRPGRLHDRIRYRKLNGHWEKFRLFP